MKSEQSFISSDKDVYESKFGACSLCVVCLFVFRELTIQQGYSIAHNIRTRGEVILNPLLYIQKKYVIWKDFDTGVFCSLTTWNFVNWQLGIDKGIHLSHICLVEAKLSEEILSHGAPFVFCGDL